MTPPITTPATCPKLFTALKMPSDATCCYIPNSSGKSAKGISAGALVCLSVATSITHNAVPEMKLAVAEKHIGFAFLFYYIETTSLIV